MEVAERMHLRHPNLLTIMGVSAEPVTEDPLLVRSGSSQVVHVRVLLKAEP